MENTKDFRKFILDNDLKQPALFNYLSIIGTAFGLIALFLFLFSPVVNYTNGLISKDYNLMDLLTLGKILIFFFSLLFSFAILSVSTIGSFIIISYFHPNNKFASKEKLFKLLFFVSMILGAVGLLFPLLISTLVSNSDDFSGNIYWYTEIGWGSYIVTVINFFSLVLSIIPATLIILTKSMYEKGEMSEETVLKSFKGFNSSKNAVSSNQKQNGNTLSLSDKINELKNLKDSGIITDEEYNSAKNELLKNYK